ncbi:ribonuclease P protein subunit p25-like protein [Belonocnema kinseyi]|uniref:ribonuclease P protein subunit p25-like protein n=1 Tax=Belonocnema kinseyi TaxID=2817044 RepID=UPI00143D1074|nr:ribonuclease P protein subunit p25-like protein [Belonocnema kinseyi]
MGKSKRKKNKRIELDPPTVDSKEGTIQNLPEKFINMQVKNGSKMRKILEYAIKEFANHDAILWTAAGEAVTKAISCVEIFKRQHAGLHQITKLGSIQSKKSLEEKDKDGKVKVRYVAQINILLTRETTQKTDLGYQAPDNTRMFWNLKNEVSTEALKEEQPQGSGSAKLKSSAAEEFTAMVGSPSPQKRSRKEQHTGGPLKKKKKGDNR